MEVSEIKKYIAYNSYNAPHQKGLELYRNKKVGEIIAEKSKISTIVQGSVPYDVVIITDGVNIKSTSCSCPYSYGGICKHTIAALYKLIECLPNLKISALKKHDTNEWFLISDNNFSVKNIIENFYYPKKNNYHSKVSVEIKSDFAEFIVFNNYYTNNVYFKIENNKIFTKCTCNKEESFLCEHQYNILELIDNSGLDNFFHDISSINIKKHIKENAKEYGLKEDDNIEEYFKPTLIDNKIKIVPIGKYEGLISQKNISENSIRKHFDKSLKLKHLEENNSKKNIYEIAYIFEKVRNNYGFKITDIQPVEGKLNKTGDKILNPLKEIKDRFLNKAELNNEDAQLYDLVKRTSVREIEVLLQKNLAKETELFDIHKQLSLHYEKIYSQIFDALLSKKFLFYVNEKGERCAFKISETKPYLFYEFNENENLYELNLKLKIDNKIYEPKDIKDNYFNYMLLIIEDTAYFFADSNDDLLFFTAIDSGSTLKSTKQNFEIFKNEFIIPISEKYPVEMNIKSKKIIEKQTDKIIKQIYISEVSNFVIFTPIVSYDNSQVNVFNKGQKLEFTDNEIIKFKRDNEFEKEFLESFRQLHHKFMNQKMLDYFFLTYDEFLKNFWFFDAFEKLNENNIEVYGIEKLSKLKYNPNKVKVALNIKSRIDWFDLNIEINFGKNKVTLKDVRRAILKKERFIKLSDGTLGVLPDEWVKNFESYFRQGDIKDNKIQISKLKFNIIEELFNKKDYSEILNEINEKKKKIKEFSSIKKVEIPHNLQGNLRDYQKAGYNWLNFLDEFNWGGILADDMGLGKTIQIIAFLLKVHSKKVNASLIVVPTTLLFNWEQELNKFAPNLSVLFHYGSARETEKIDLKKYDLIITTYGIMTRDVELLSKYKFSYIILDESQAIKNPESQRFKASLLLNAKNRITMTGTPIENNTFDLYAQMEFVNPGFLGSKNSFKELYSDPIDKNQNTEIAKELQKVINPFILRRTKEQVAKELPDKTETYMFCEMEQEQRKVYEAFKNKYRDMLLHKIDEEGLGKSKIYVIEGLMKLRQICDSPAILSDDYDYGNESVKIKELIRNIKEKTGKHKILVFSQFVKMLSEVKKQLTAENIVFEYLDGQSSQKQRQDSVENFQQDDNIKVFLISLKAGGTGINLTSADYVYLIDPWWNPAVENQAIDRTHRIGQDKKVIAYRMICKDTIEEKIMKYQERKMKIASEIITTEDNFVKQLKKEDIVDLFN